MTKLRLSPQARSDLDDIWQYSAKTWNEDQAETYMRGLKTAFQILITHPNLGRSLDDIREGYFKFPVASHILIYRIGGEVVEVIRILHKSMDVERQIPRRI